MRRNTPHYSFRVTMTTGLIYYVYGPIAIKPIEAMQELFDDDGLIVASIERVSKIPPDAQHQIAI